MSATITTAAVSVRLAHVYAELYCWADDACSQAACDMERADLAGAGQAERDAIARRYQRYSRLRTYIDARAEAAGIILG